MEIRHFGLILLLSIAWALDTPCEEKFVGDECLFDEECRGPNTRCLGGECTCAQGFDVLQQNDATKKITVTNCVPGGREPGDQCNSEFGCQAPMLCRDGRCECYGGTWNRGSKTCVVDSETECDNGEKLVGHECQKVRSLGDSCDEDYECQDPLAICATGPKENVQNCASADRGRNRGRPTVSGSRDGRRKRPATKRRPGTKKKPLSKKVREIREQRRKEREEKRRREKARRRGKRATNAVCRCAPGTKRCGNQCIAVCPDGEAPLSRTCRRMFLNNDDVLAHKDQLDNCPKGYQCMTYGKPAIGHCCRAHCPMGNPNTAWSCEAGASQRNQCRKLTHYCHELGGPGWKTAVCCPKPCREPTPLYFNGECLALSHRGDPCRFDEQCEGGSTMVCNRRNKCVCRKDANGFRYLQENSGRFKTCVKACDKETEVVVEKTCLPLRGLKEACMSSLQCPDGAYCYYGTCTCQCGYTASRIGNGCTKPGDPLGITDKVDVGNLLKGGQSFLNRLGFNKLGSG